MSRLSPLNAANISRNALARANGAGTAGLDTKDLNRRFRRYACAACTALHEREYDAERCCPQDTYEVFVDPETGQRFDSMSELEEALGRSDDAYDVCPSCRRQYEHDAHEAANCCLWKDFDAAARYRIATLVEGGSEWAAAIASVSTP